MKQNQENNQIKDIKDKDIIIINDKLNNLLSTEQNSVNLKNKQEYSEVLNNPKSERSSFSQQLENLQKFTNFVKQNSDKINSNNNSKNYNSSRYSNTFVDNEKIIEIGNKINNENVYSKTLSQVSNKSNKNNSVNIISQSGKVDNINNRDSKKSSIKN